jgi:hypothetical protein
LRRWHQGCVVLSVHPVFIFDLRANRHPINTGLAQSVLGQSTFAWFAVFCVSTIFF